VCLERNRSHVSSCQARWSGRGLIGQIIARYEAKGLTIRALELRQADAALAAQHYVEHVGRDYYPSLEAFITSGPLVAMVLEGERAIDAVSGH
jgi:nucleoside-diphosphate kinase